MFQEFITAGVIQIIITVITIIHIKILHKSWLQISPTTSLPPQAPLPSSPPSPDLSAFSQTPVYDREYSRVDLVPYKQVDISDDIVFSN